MVQTFDFGELVWNRHNIVLPGKKTHALAHLHMTMEMPPTNEDCRLYSLVLTRSQQVIGYIKVKPEETDDLRMLQNMLLKSRLNLS